MSALGVVTVRDVSRSLISRTVVAMMVALVAWELSRIININLHLGFMVLGALLAAPISLIVTPAWWPNIPVMRWEVRPDPDKAKLPRERRAMRLADMARGVEPASMFSCTEMRTLLRHHTADRLVRHHGARPDHPLDDAAGLVSAPLLTYLTSATAAPLRRATLAAYLKEIDSL